MKLKSHGIRLVVLFALLIIGGICFPHQKALAATAVQVAAVEYYDDNIIVFNNGNTKIYFATDTDAASGNWDCVTADSSDFTMIDLSWLAPDTENVIMVKGDLDETPSRVVIKEKPIRLNITINYSNLGSLLPGSTIAPLLNIMSTEGTADAPITFEDLEWKKGDNGRWESVNSLTVEMLDKFLVKGAYLYFRIRALDDCVGVTIVTPTNTTLVDLNDNRVQGIAGGIRAYEKVSGVQFGSDYPDGTQGRRFSEEVRLKIVKKAATMVSGVDGEDFTAAIKFGKEYKVTLTYSDGTKGYADWKQVTDRSVRKISLETLANSIEKKDTTGKVITFNGTDVPFPEMFIEVRDCATSKTAASKVTDITLSAQRTLSKKVSNGLPSSTVTQTDEDVYVYYFGNKYILLTIPKASATLPYEYCIIKKDDKFDLSRATWSIITKGSSVKLLASKAVEGGTIYIRQREIKSKEATHISDAISYQLASTYITHTIDYPSIPVITKANLTYTKHYSASTPLTITVNLNELGNEPFEIDVKSIKLGMKDIGFDPPVITPKIAYNTDGTINKTLTYVMTITLKSTDMEALTNCINRILTINFTNGTVDKSSIKLTIKSPTGAASLNTSAIAGSTSGTSKVSVVSSLGAGNKWVYVVGPAAAATGINMEDILPAGTEKDFTSGMEIAVTADQYITVYEIDATRHIIKYRSLQIKSTMIK